MIDTTNIAALIGADVLTTDGEKLGTVAQIFVSPSDGQPRWVAIHHGLGHDWIAPLVDATSGDESITLPLDKKLVKKAPKTTAPEGLSLEQDAALSEYYDGALSAGDRHDEDARAFARARDEAQAAEAEPHDEADLPGEGPKHAR